jgi:hypothetical protein
MVWLVAVTKQDLSHQLQSVAAEERFVFQFAVKGVVRAPSEAPNKNKATPWTGTGGERVRRLSPASAEDRGYVTIVRDIRNHFSGKISICRLSLADKPYRRVGKQRPTCAAAGSGHCPGRARVGYVTFNSSEMF